MNCPLCGGDRAGQALRSGGGAIMRCPDCGLLYREPYRSCTAAKCADCADRCIDRLADPGFLEARLRVDARRAARIEKLAGGLARLKVLEIGAGLGCLGRSLSRAAAFYRGTEASPVFYGCLKKNFPELAGSVENAFLPSPGEKGSFDLVVLVDSLQFAPDPAKFLRAAAEYLTPGGLVYLELPDESSLTLRAAARKLLGLYRGAPLHHGHINFFTARSLPRLLGAAGLEPRVLTQASIVSDEDRLFLTLKKTPPFWVRALSLAARLTAADTLLRLGNTVCLCARPEKKTIAC